MPDPRIRPGHLQHPGNGRQAQEHRQEASWIRTGPWPRSRARARDNPSRARGAAVGDPPKFDPPQAGSWMVGPRKAWMNGRGEFLVPGSCPFSILKPQIARQDSFLGGVAWVGFELRPGSLGVAGEVSAVDHTPSEPFRDPRAYLRYIEPWKTTCSCRQFLVTYVSDFVTCFVVKLNISRFQRSCAGP